MTTECLVCYSPIQDCEVNFFPCGHSFCQECIVLLEERCSMCGLTLEKKLLNSNESEVKKNDDKINNNQGIRELSSLTIDEVSNLLLWANMSNFVEIFRERKIDGLTLSSCEELSDIQECGVDIKPKAKSFLKHIINFKSNGVPEQCFVGNIRDGGFVSQRITDINRRVSASATFGNNLSYVPTLSVAYSLIYTVPCRRKQKQNQVILNHNS